MWKFGILAVLLVGLTAAKCTNPVSSCPRMLDYSPEFRKELAVEVKQILTMYPHVVQVLKDYWGTREQITECMNRNTKPTAPTHTTRDVITR